MEAFLVVLLFVFVAFGLLALCSENAQAKQARLRAQYEQRAVQLAAEAAVYEAEAEVCRTEQAFLYAQIGRDLAVARRDQVRSIPPRQLAALEARLRARAAAEAQAVYKLQELQAENYRLSQHLAALTWDGNR